MNGCRYTVDYRQKKLPTSSNNNKAEIRKTLELFKNKNLKDKIEKPINKEKKYIKQINNSKTFTNKIKYGTNDGRENRNKFREKKIGFQNNQSDIGKLNEDKKNLKLKNDMINNSGNIKERQSKTILSNENYNSNYRKTVNSFHHLNLCKNPTDYNLIQSLINDRQNINNNYNKLVNKEKYDDKDRNSTDKVKNNVYVKENKKIINNKRNNMKEKVISVNQNGIESKTGKYKKDMYNNIYMPINNNVKNNNLKDYKTIEININKDEDRYDYNDDGKKKINERINKNNEDHIKKERSFNYEINNNNYYLINSNDKILEFQINNLSKCNFNKNSSTSKIYISPNKAYNMNNKRTIDDKHIDYYNDENCNNIENNNSIKYKMIKNSQYIYQKKRRNSRSLNKRNLENEFKNNKYIDNKRSMDNSFSSKNSSIYSYEKEKKSESYMNNSTKNSQNNNKHVILGNNNDNIIISEIFNRNNSNNNSIIKQSDNNKSINLTLKKNGEQYYYQRIDKRNKISKDNNNDLGNTYDKIIDPNKTKTFNIKRKNNNIIFDNYINSIISNDNNEENDSNKKNYQKKIFNKKRTPINHFKNNNYNMNSNNKEDDFINTDKPDNELCNKINKYNKINKKIETKKLAIDSLKNKKESNSFNDEVRKNKTDKYNYYKKLSKNHQRLILNRKYNFKYNINNSNSELTSNMDYDNNNKTVNSSLFIKKKITNTVKNSPKCINDIVNQDAPYPITLLENVNNYFYNNNKAIESFYRDRSAFRKTTSNMNNIKESSNESTPKKKGKVLYHKKNSMNHYGLENSNQSIANNKSEFNKTYYLKKTMDSRIYRKKNLNNKILEFSNIISNKTYKKEQTDNNTMNSSGISSNKNNQNIKNNININLNNNIYFKNRNEINESSTFNNNENDEFVVDDGNKQFYYSLKDLNEKVKNSFNYYNKLYNYYIERPKTKICYIEKYKKSNKKEKKQLNNSSINVSKISENKNNEYISFNISFNNNNNKKKVKKSGTKEIPSGENIVNDKNIISDFDSKDISEGNNFHFGSSNDRNKISNIKKVENESNFDYIIFDLSEEKDIINPQEKEKDNIQIKSFHIDIDKQKNDEELTNNNLNNSNSKKKNKKYQKENELSKNISLATKKLVNIFHKSNDNDNNDNYEKRKELKKVETENNIILGYSKLNNIFRKKSNEKDYLRDKMKTSTFKVNRNRHMNDKNKQETINYELNDDIEMKQKTYTYKVKRRNNILQTEENNVSSIDNKKKIYNLENIVSLKDNSFSLKDNLLNEQVKLHINDLLNPDCQYSQTKTNELKNNNSNYNSNVNENKIEDKINDILEILDEKNIDFMSEQIGHIILYYNNSYILNKKTISKKYLDNLNTFVNILLDNAKKENNNISLYTRLFNKINILLSKEQINNNKDNSLEKIFINEYLKRINNKESFKYFKKEDFKKKLFDLIYYLLELVSSELIKMEVGLNITCQILNIYETDKNNYIYLEGSIYLFDSLIEKIIRETKIEEGIYNSIKIIEEKFRKALLDKNVTMNLTNKISSILEKIKKINRKEDNKDNNIINNDSIKDNKDENIKEEIKVNNEEENIKHDINNDIIINKDEINNKDNENYNINNDKIEEKINDEKINVNSCKIENNNEKNDNINLNKNQDKILKNNVVDENNDYNNKENYCKTNSNFYNTFTRLIKNKNDESKTKNNAIIENKNEDRKSIKNVVHSVTHKKKAKSKIKSKSTEKRTQLKSIDLLKKEREDYSIFKEEIKKDFEKYCKFLEKKGINEKEDIYEELNDSYNWKIIDDLIMKKDVKLEEIIKIFIKICKKENIKESDTFKANEYIKTIIEFYITELSENQIEILHLNMVEIYMAIDDIVNNQKSGSLNMYNIMGNLLFVLLSNKLFYMKDLNNFIDKDRETQINVAKVGKYAILASGKFSKQCINDFKYTKLFNNSDIFTQYIENDLNDTKDK